MPGKSTNGLSASSQKSSLELTEELIRIHAYLIYEKRGCENGHDLEDWLQAEAEILGKKPAVTAESKKDMGKATAA